LPNPWPNCPGLSAGAAAALASLHLSEPRTDLLARLSDREARETLAYCDRSQLTLAVRNAAPDFQPAEMTERAEKNRVRLQVVQSLYQWLRNLLMAPEKGDPLEFVVLKGITQCALSGIRLEDRAQYDVDLYLPRPAAEAASSRLVDAGYIPMEGMEAFPTDHLPALVKRGDWEFRGDLFDTAMPLAIELHFQFWNPGLERLPAPGVEDFWNRRVIRLVGDDELPVLAPPDAFAYAALHLLKHVLRGNTRPFHVYELARCLHHQATNGALWQEWQQLHAPQMRGLQAVVFRLAECWFGCDMAPEVREEIDRLPELTRTWFDEFAASPATNPFLPNKDELWLHLSLLDSVPDRLSVARRRLVPGNLPPPVSSARSRGTMRARVEYARHFSSRFRHHTISLFTTLASGLRWWWRTNDFGPQFWIFLAAAVLFNFGLFIFFLLYNLFLSDAGFDMRLLGEMNSAARVGSMVGTLPAAYLAYRIGLRRTLLSALGITTVLMLLRAFAIAQTTVLVLAFAASCVFSLWAVVMAPSIAAAVEEKQRPAAFSLFFSLMFATGIVGNWIGGRLPGWLHGKQPALVASAVICGLSVVPALSLTPSSAAAPGARLYPRGKFLLRFLVPFAIWHLATGAFNPFNNVYFEKLKFSMAQIGSVFSAAQLAQVVAVLLAPLVIRRLGLVSGIVWMMGATALALGGLALQPAGGAAVAAYMAYMSFQWMSEPGLNTLLMNQVAERERGGAAAINYLVAFAAQAVAALASGALAGPYGFGSVLLGAAATAGVAAVLFQRLLSRTEKQPEHG
jgi:MFS family permease